MQLVPLDLFTELQAVPEPSLLGNLASPRSNVPFRQQVHVAHFPGRTRVQVVQHLTRKVYCLQQVEHFSTPEKLGDLQLTGGDDQRRRWLVREQEQSLDWDKLQPELPLALAPPEASSTYRSGISHPRIPPPGPPNSVVVIGPSARRLSGAGNDNRGSPTVIPGGGRRRD